MKNSGSGFHELETLVTTELFKLHSRTRLYTVEQRPTESDAGHHGPSGATSQAQSHDI